jgi:hypothetical protein
MTAAELRTDKERTLFTICAVFSAGIWLVGGLLMICYLPFIAFFVIAAHALMLAGLTGHAVRVGPDQLPAVWASVERASQVLGLSSPPEAAPVSRSLAAWVLAPLFGFTSPAGLGAMYIVAMIGVLAAIAIPNFVEMQYRAKRAEVPNMVDRIKVAEWALDSDGEPSIWIYGACDLDGDGDPAIYESSASGSVTLLTSNAIYWAGQAIRQHPGLTDDSDGSPFAERRVVGDGSGAIPRVARRSEGRNWGPP